MRRVRSAVAAVTLAVVGTLGITSPAAADHLLDVSSTGCYGTPLSAGFPHDVTTSKVKVHKEKDGVVRATCHFTGLPESFYNDYYGFPWERPDRPRITEVTACVLSGHGGDPVFGWYGEGTVTVTPGGTAKVDCVFTREP